MILEDQIVTVETTDSVLKIVGSNEHCIQFSDDSCITYDHFQQCCENNYCGGLAIPCNTLQEAFDHELVHLKTITVERSKVMKKTKSNTRFMEVKKYEGLDKC